MKRNKFKKGPRGSPKRYPVPKRGTQKGSPGSPKGYPGTPKGTRVPKNVPGPPKCYLKRVLRYPKRYLGAKKAEPMTEPMVETGYMESKWGTDGGTKGRDWVTKFIL